MHASVVAEQQAVAAARAGNPEGFDLLYRFHRPFVFNVCRRMLKNDPRAEEITQDTFIRAMEKIGQFEERSTFRTWIFKIAYRLCLMELRSNKLGPPLVPITELVQAPDEYAGASIIRDAMPELLYKHVVEGYTTPELSEMTGTKIATVKDRLKRQRHQLVFGTPRRRPHALSMTAAVPA